MNENRALIVDLYELTMAECYWKYKPSASATFDLFVRALPANRLYLIAAGLGDVVAYLKGWRFTNDCIAYLRRQRLFSDDFLRYLKRLRFTGEVWAMPEGSVFFAGEPVIRVTAPLIQAQLIESYLLNTVNLQTMIASKASRIVQAAGGRSVFDYSLRRTHGAEAGIKAARSSYLAGVSGTSAVLAGKRYGMPIVGTMAHSFVMSFKHELDSFIAYAATFPARTTLLVDTYGTRKGIENAVIIGRYLKERQHRLQGIRLDSGDIVYWSRYARAAFDRAGLFYVKIVASGNLDERAIARLIKAGAPLDSFGVGTNMGTSSDAPSLDVIYKLSETTDEDGNFIPTMKLSHGKATFPGRKQVYRVRDARGIYRRDTIGLEGEKVKGRPLLVKVLQGGRLTHRQPSLEDARRRVQQELKHFPQGLLSVERVFPYSVEASPALVRLRRKLRSELTKRQ